MYDLRTGGFLRSGRFMNQTPPGHSDACTAWMALASVCSCDVINRTALSELCRGRGKHLAHTDW